MFCERIVLMLHICSFRATRSRVYKNPWQDYEFLYCLVRIITIIEFLTLRFRNRGHKQFPGKQGELLSHTPAAWRIRWLSRCAIVFYLGYGIGNMEFTNANNNTAENGISRLNSRHKTISKFILLLFKDTQNTWDNCVPSGQWEWSLRCYKEQSIRKECIDLVFSRAFTVAYARYSPFALTLTRKKKFCSFTAYCDLFCNIIDEYFFHIPWISNN